MKRYVGFLFFIFFAFVTLQGEGARNRVDFSMAESEIVLALQGKLSFSGPVADSVARFRE